MKNSLKIALGIILGVLGLATCGILACLAFGMGGVALLGTILVATSTSVGNVPLQPIVRITPSPLPKHAGEYVEYGGMRVALIAYEFSGLYKTAEGGQAQPPEGAKFLWLRIQVENAGQNTEFSPYPYDLAILYKEEQIDTDLHAFSDRPGYEFFEREYIYPGVTRSGWIRFTIPLVAQPEDIKVLLDSNARGYFLHGDYIWVLAP